MLIATPGLLIALLRTIAIGWQHAKVQENAKAIADAAGELYGRLRVYGEHVGSVDKALQRAVESYNRSVGSLESRVLVQARRLEDLGAAGGERIAAVAPVELDVRPVATPELPPGDDGRGDT